MSFRHELPRPRPPAKSPLSRVERAIVRTLVCHTGQTLTFSQLGELIWGHSFPSEEHIRFHLANLHRKVEGTVAHSAIVVTENAVVYLPRAGRS